MSSSAYPSSGSGASEQSHSQLAADASRGQAGPSDSSSNRASSLMDCVSISGATLASLLGGLINSRGDKDGLLMGSVVRRPVVEYGDEERGSETREDVQVVITGVCSSGQLLSFYDATGCVDVSRLAGMLRSSRESDFEARLQSKQERQRQGPAGQGSAVPSTAHLQQEGVVGWYVQRNVSVLSASMREVAVTANLRALGLSPNHADVAPISASPVLAVFTSSHDLHASIHSFDYRLFQLMPPARGSSPLGSLLHALPLRVLNLGTGLRSTYNSFMPMSSDSLLLPSTFTWQPEEGQRQQHRKHEGEELARGNAGQQIDGVHIEGPIAASGAGVGWPLSVAVVERQVGAVEKLYEEALDRLTVLAAEVGESEALLSRQQQQHSHHGSER